MTGEDQSTADGAAGRGRRSRARARARGATLAGPAAAIALGAALLAPPDLWAFEVYGDVLDLDQRDYRILATFSGPYANTNQVPDPDFPGSLGAELAIRKGVAEWGSRPHGSGTTDPSQDVLGSGGANFDAFYAGRATDPGGPNRNVISVIAGGGPSFAFTELPTGDGWRIRFFDLSREWSDRPSGPPFGVSLSMDIQGIAAHEYGHALGLDHTPVAGATMSTATSNRGLDLRSIEADDVAGVRFLYGDADPRKPIVADYELSGPGVVRLLGRNFHPTDNEVWFTPAAPTDPAEDPIVRVGGVASTAGGSVLEVAVPPEAGRGDVAVRVPGATGAALSNAFPFDPGMEPWTPPVAYGAPTPSSNGAPVALTPSGIPSLTAGTLRLLVTGAAVDGPAILVVGTERASAATPFGALAVGGALDRAATFTVSFGAGLVDLDLTRYAPAPGAVLRVTAWVPDGGASGGVFSEAVEITVTE